MKQPGASPQTVAGLPRTASPLVSVVMAVYNGEKYLAEAIKSILAQTFDDFELLIIDDGSTDKSAEIIRGYEKRDARIRSFKLERNSGLPVARNHGLRACKGSYITLMDCDDVSLPERLQKQVDFLEINPAVGAVGTSGTVVESDLSLRYDRETPEHHAIIITDFFWGNPFICASVMMRRHLPFDAGLYKESIRFAQDLDLMLRLVGRTRFANIPEVLYVYRQHTASNMAQHGENIFRERYAAFTRHLQRLWCGVPDGTLARLEKIRLGQKLNWREWWAAKRDLNRLVEAMINNKWIEADDLPLIRAYM